MLALFRERRKRSFSWKRARKLAIPQGERPLPTSLTAASCLLGHLPLNRQLRCLGKALANAAAAIPVPCSLLTVPFDLPLAIPPTPRQMYATEQLRFIFYSVRLNARGLSSSSPFSNQWSTGLPFSSFTKYSLPPRPVYSGSPSAVSSLSEMAVS